MSRAGVQSVGQGVGLPAEHLERDAHSHLLEGAGADHAPHARRLNVLVVVFVEAVEAIDRLHGRHPVAAETTV